MKTLKIAAAVCLMLLAAKAVAQEQTPLRVGAFGGVQGPLQPVKAPSELKPFVPQGLVLRAVIHTRMAPVGETLLLYDNDEGTFPEVHLHALRNGQDLKLFDGVIAGFAGLLPIQTEGNRQVLGFAYHVGFDGADTTFVLFAAEKDFYRKIFEQKTTSGQMRVFSGSPAKLELWSADWNLDKGESCVWCPHRYHVRTYVWQGGSFILTTQRTTPAPLRPGDIAERTFVVSSN